jgi:hypothetical protein
MNDGYFIIFQLKVKKKIAGAVGCQQVGNK